VHRRDRWRGRHVLVTAGPTRAPLDRVRYISNRSSGATGVAVATALRTHGARVHLVYGPGRARPPRGVEVLSVETPAEMREAVLAVLAEHEIAAAVLAAAVLDFVPASFRDEKVPSGRAITVELVPTPKLIDEVVRAAPAMVTVGFKLEYGVSDEALAATARAFLERLGLSAVLANDLARITETVHPALLMTADGRIERVAGKPAIAEAIVTHIERALTAGRPS